MGPCNIVLQHEVMVVDEWHNNGPQDLCTVSLCIQNAIKCEYLPTQVGYDDKLQSGGDPDEDDEHADELP